MIKINYDETTGEILGRYPDEIHYHSIPTPWIEVENCKLDDSERVNLQTLTLENKPQPQPEEETSSET